MQEDSTDGIKFVHAADLHLGSSFCGLTAIDADVATLLSNATFKAFDNMVEFCIQQSVDFLLISGDIYDSADRRIYEQIKFRDNLTRLAEAGIPVFLAFGNHDPLPAWSAHLNWPDSVHIMGCDSPDLHDYDGKNGNRARIVGISHQSAQITANLASTFPPKETDWPFTIGMLHCNLGASPDHESYAPCSLSDLAATGYDYWALGHIHKPTIVKDQSPAIVYPGNSQGRHIRENGRRGACFVTVGQDQSPVIELIDTDVIRWIAHEVEIDDVSTEDELIRKLELELDEMRRQAGGRRLLCRITLQGRSLVHTSLVSDGVISDILHYFREREDGRDDFVFIERLADKTAPPIDRDQLALRESLCGDVVRLTDGLVAEPGELHGLKPVLAELFDTPQAKKFVGPITLEELTELISEAETYLLDRLVGDTTNENM